MNEPTNENNIGQEVSNRIVLTDKDSAKLRRADEAIVRAILKQRFAMFAKIKALRDEKPDSEDSASELWEEMPQVAKEYEAFDSDEDAAA